MADLISFGITVFVGFFAMMNPIANTPIFISLTDGLRPNEKCSIARRSCLIAFLIVATFCLLGKIIFDMFGITIPAFRITGGILVFLIGKDMLSGNTSDVHTPSHEDNEKSLDAKLSIAISPLATPILGGPGIIASAMNFVGDQGLKEIMVILVALANLCVITYFFFISGERFIKFIGESAIKVISRMMGLILAVMGVQMIILGIYGAVHLYK
ncbi:membrane protein [Endozoicomonas montiporae]|uniref:UPF0056 membrane protein n=2 Tax=Endozoicomonas montiporae TaxID=1027273 RepID=A0A081N051_9GAMM|nr:MarC family protein [Endozoicomonas montiporae]AMO58840.1 multiple antibiotic resistance protein [Endozoicomonas montiporae CL-33]KEQ11824.1 membrane protein [Endozoicomonas montiporae]